MSQIKDLCATLGRSEMANRLGVSDSAIKEAVRHQKLPAAWFVVVSAMCTEKGVQCPHSLFRFREAAE